MNPNGSSGLSVTADAGATSPALGRIDAGLFVASGVLLVAAGVHIAAPRPCPPQGVMTFLADIPTRSWRSTNVQPRGTDFGSATSNW